MAKMEQALILEPPTELHFKAPFTNVTTSYLHLHNPTERDICFKVKTTAPKTYCVRPNSGIVWAQKSCAISVMLQPIELDDADKGRHKFMVQSIFAPEGQYSLDSLWRDIPPEGFMNSKLKCVFDVDEAPQATKTIKLADPKPAQDKESYREMSVNAQDKESYHEDVASKVDTDGISQKLQSTNRRLQNEINELRQENSLLKEEGLRLRKTYDTRSRGTSAKPTEMNPNVSKQQLQLSNTYIVLSIIIFLLGIYLGKYIL